MKKIGIIGISGRVGRALYRQCLDHAKYTCTAGYARLTAPDLPLCFSLNDLFISCDYVVDFSSPDLMPDIVKTCLSHPKPLVIGTTGMAYNVTLPAPSLDFSLKTMILILLTVTTIKKKINLQAQPWPLQSLSSRQKKPLISALPFNLLTPLVPLTPFK
jgi:hypothetical protein